MEDKKCNGSFQLSFLIQVWEFHFFHSFILHANLAQILPPFFKPLGFQMPYLLHVYSSLLLLSDVHQWNQYGLTSAEYSGIIIVLMKCKIIGCCITQVVHITLKAALGNVKKALAYIFYIFLCDRKGNRKKEKQKNNNKKWVPIILTAIISIFTVYHVSLFLNLTS